MEIFKVPENVEDLDGWPTILEEAESPGGQWMVMKVLVAKKN